MPSFEKIAARRFVAMKRLEDARKKLSEKTGVEVAAPKPVKTTDPEFRQVVQLESFADTLEALIAKYDEMFGKLAAAAPAKRSTKTKSQD